MTPAEGTACLFGTALVVYAVLCLLVLRVWHRHLARKHAREDRRYFEMLERNRVRSQR